MGSAQHERLRRSCAPRRLAARPVLLIGQVDFVVFEEASSKLWNSFMKYTQCLLTYFIQPFCKQPCASIPNTALAQCYTFEYYRKFQAKRKLCVLVLSLLDRWLLKTLIYAKTASSIDNFRDRNNRITTHQSRFVTRKIR